MLDESSSSSLHPEYGITQAIWLAGEALFYQKVKQRWLWSAAGAGQEFSPSCRPSSCCGARSNAIDLDQGHKRGFLNPEC